MAITDDAVREVHGVKALGSDNHIDLREEEDAIKITTCGSQRLTPYQARYLAAKLYRLSRRIRARTETA